MRFVARCNVGPCSRIDSVSMPAPLRYLGLGLVVLTGVLSILTGYAWLGSLVIVLGAATILPPFPPMVAGAAAVVLTPIPASLVYHSGHYGAWVLVLPLVATAVAVLEWRAVVWSGAIMGVACGVCTALVG